MSTTPVYTTTLLPKSGVNIHYVATPAPAADAKTIVLLHGYPSSAHQFRNLIPLLAPKYRIIAPDLPGFGYTTVPEGYKYSFDNIAVAVEELLDSLNVKQYYAYGFDYGFPTLMRLAASRPDAIQGIIAQNGNAYEEGLSSWWDGLKIYWANQPGDAEYERIRKAAVYFASLEGIKEQYTVGLTPAQQATLDPSTWTLDYLQASSTPEKLEIQLDLFYSYGTNVARYAPFQKWMRDSKVPLIGLWGGGDIIFDKVAAKAFEKDMAGRKGYIHIFEDGGHFLLETHVKEVAERILAFLGEL